MAYSDSGKSELDERNQLFSNEVGIVDAFGVVARQLWETTKIGTTAAFGAMKNAAGDVKDDITAAAKFVASDSFVYVVLGAIAFVFILIIRR